MGIKFKVQPGVINKIYRKYLFDNTRTQIFFGGSSSGKSAFLAQRANVDILNGRNYLVVRNVQRTQRQSTFNEIIKQMNAFGNIKKYFKINQSELNITCNLNNKQILFCGLDDVEKIKSITPIDGVLDTIWIEEATEIQYTDFKQLLKRLRGKSKFPKRIVLSFNPVSKDNWIYRTLFKEWNDTDSFFKTSDKLILKTTYKDNSFLEPDDIKSLENEDDRYFHDVYTLGNWGVLGSVIFKNWKMEDLSWLKDIADKTKNGLDFGFARDPAGLTNTYYDKKKKTIYILDEIYEIELTNDILAEKIKNIIGDDVVVCDSAEPKSIKEIKIHKVNAVAAEKGKGSINHGIQWLRQQKIIVDVNCQNHKNEFTKYKWKEDKNGLVLPVPVDRDNHLMDALRYAYEDEYKKGLGGKNTNAFTKGEKITYEEW